MMAVPSFSFSAMDNMNQDENMDFGSDMPAHDADFDFDLPDASRATSAELGQDVMIDIQDVANQQASSNVDTKDAGDDDMLDEEFVAEEAQNVDETMDNDDGQHSATMYDDEDLIYEDEEAIENEERDSTDIDFKKKDLSGGDHATEEVNTRGVVETTAEQVIEQQSLQEQIHQSETDAEENSAQYHSNYVTSQQPETQAPTSSDDNHRPTSTGLDESPTDLVAQQQTIDGVRSQEFEPENEQPVAESSYAQAPTESNENSDSISAAIVTTESADHKPVDNTIGQQQQPEGSTENDDEYDTPLLHPIKVQYDGTELCLFPPIEGEDTFFVQDSSLAFSPCDQLLGACREVLGDSIEDDHELVLDFPSLGLHLSEGSPYAKELTLAQILEVYVSLCQNDQLDTIPPLQCILRTRITLASQYAFLLSATNDGKGLAEVSFEVQHRSKPEEAFEIISTHDIASESGDGHLDKVALRAGDSTNVPPNQRLSEDQAAETENDHEAADGEHSLSAVVNEHHPNALEDESSGRELAVQERPDENFDARSDISSELELGPEVDTFGSHAEEEPLPVLQQVDGQDVPEPLSGEITEGVPPRPDSDSDRTVQPDSHHTSCAASVTGDADSVAVNDFAIVEPEESEGVNTSVDSRSGTLPLEIDALRTSQEAELLERSDIEELDGGFQNEGNAGDDTNDPNSEHLLDFTGQDANGKIQTGIAESVEIIETSQSSDHTLDGSAHDDAAHGEDGLIEDVPNTADEDDLLSFTDDIPVSGHNPKRKLQDSDDYGLVDPTTPEKKKRRPS